MRHGVAFAVMTYGSETGWPDSRQRISCGIQLAGQMKSQTALHYVCFITRHSIWELLPLIQTGRLSFAAKNYRVRPRLNG